MGQDFHTPILRDLHANHGAVVADDVGLCSGKDALEEVEGHRPFANPQTSGKRLVERLDSDLYPDVYPSWKVSNE
jgi:hypothetical protein